MSWTLLAQIVSVLSMLILPRLVMPTQFGIFSMFSGVVVMVGIVAAGRYEFAIGLPESNQEGAALFTLCAACALVVGLVCWLVLISLPLGNPLFLRFSALNAWWAWVAPGAACVALYNAASYLALRAARFSSLGRSKAIVAGATAVGQVAAATFVTQQEGALIVPLLVGQLFGVAGLILALSDRGAWCGDASMILKAARRYSRFPKYVAPASLFDGIAVLLPLVVIAAVYSPAQAGVFALADRTLKMPVTLVGSSVLQVFYERAAKLRDDPTGARQLLLQTWRNLALLAALPCLAVIIWGPLLFQLVFGPNWREAGAIARLMIVGIFVYFVSYPTSNILVVNERVKSFMVWQAAQLTLVGGSLALAVLPQPGSLTSTVALLVTGQICISLLSMALQWRAVVGQKAAEA